MGVKTKQWTKKNVCVTKDDSVVQKVNDIQLQSFTRLRPPVSFFI